MDTQQSRSDDEFWKFRAEQPQHVVFDISVVPPRMVLDDTAFLDIEAKMDALGINPDLLTADNSWSFSECIANMMKEEPLGELLPDLELGEGIEGLIQKRSFDYELIGGL